MPGKIWGAPRRKPDSFATAGATPGVSARRAPLVALMGCCIASVWLCACSDAPGNNAPSAGTGGVAGSSGGGGGKFAAGGTASDGGAGAGESYAACQENQ